MATRDRRRAAATATVGAGATFGGGVLRHKGVRAAHEGEDAPGFKWSHPIATHQTRALLRPGARGRNRYLVGATLGLVGAPALAVGGHDYVVRKAKKDRNFLSEGLHGTQDALHQRAEGLKETPPAAKVGPFAVGAGAGAAGSWGGHLALNRFRAFQGGRNHALRAGVTALTGATAAAASLPISRHAVRGEYEVTPAGVRRRKRAAVRPSSKAKVFDQKQMSRRAYRNATVGSASKAETLPAIRMHTRSERAVRAKRNQGRFAKAAPTPQRAHELALGFARKGKLIEQKRALELRNRLIGKADYAGRHTSPHEQRAKTMAAGAIPGIPFAGPVAAARVAGHYAPPGEKRKAEARQLGSSVATTATGVGGAYLAAGNRRAGDQALRMHRGMQRAGERITRPVRSRISLKTPGGNRIASVKARGSARAQQTLARSSTLRRAVGPLRANKPAAVAGYIAGAKLTGMAYQNVAISRNQAAQRRYDLKHPNVKKLDATGMNPREQRRMIERKRRSAATSVVTGTLGVAGAGMGAALLPGVRGRLKPKHVHTLERAAVGTGLAAGGISGVHSIRSARLQRHELDAQERALTSKRFNAMEHDRLLANALGDKRLKQVRGRVALHPNTQIEIVRGTPGSSVASASGSGMGRGRGSLHISEGGIRDDVLRHERAHLAPRRNTARFRERMADPRRKGREEARADYLAGREHTPGSYPLIEPDSQFRLGYNEVAWRMGSRGTRRQVHKADSHPLTRMRDDQAHQIVRRYGSAGPLPKELSREDRMRAYEARYVHAGGHKAEHWQRRADVADKVKTGGLAGATAAGAGIMALRHPRVARAMGHRIEGARRAADTAAIGAATVSGAGELYSGHARRRRSSYSNSKAGVAASALRRMKDYSG